MRLPLKKMRDYDAHKTEHSASSQFALTFRARFFTLRLQAHSGPQTEISRSSQGKCVGLAQYRFCGGKEKGRFLFFFVFLLSSNESSLVGQLEGLPIRQSYQSVSKGPRNNFKGDWGEDTQGQALVALNAMFQSPMIQATFKVIHDVKRFDSILIL
jgi:hypothetical protein